MSTGARSRSIASRLVILAACIATAPLAAAAGDDRVDELIQRLEQQEREIQALRQEVNELRNGGVVQPTAGDQEPARQIYRREEGDDPTTDAGNPGIRIEVSGQINQAINVAGDGRETKAYFVDNDTSNTRLRFAGVASFESGLEMGPLLEIAFSPNPSSDVSQDDEVTGDFFQVRRAELYALDERYGRLTFGRGSAAADNTAEYDLSLVSGPIMYSGVSDIVGGLFFTDGHELSGIRVRDAFSNFDGNRQNRIRYDSPMWGPVQLSLSYGSDQRKDAAITFGGDYDRWTGIDIGSFTTLGAFSVSDPSDDHANVRVAGSWSLLHNPTGLNFTVSSGFDGGTGRSTPYNVYGKLGWNTKLLRFGPTGFGVDYTWSENVNADGDRGQSVGLAAVQVLDRWGIEFYSQFRAYMLDQRYPPSLDDIFVGTVGTRVRF